MDKTVTPDNHLLTYNEVIVDISMLYDVAANDEAFVKLMVDTFLRTVPASLTNIRESFENEDYDGLYQHAHKMKSTISVVKINDMLEWIKEIEQYAKQKSKSAVLEKLINKVSERFLIVTQILSNKFSS